jgi:hypothetical protein
MRTKSSKISTTSSKVSTHSTPFKVFAAIGLIRRYRAKTEDSVRVNMRSIPSKCVRSGRRRSKFGAGLTLAADKSWVVRIALPQPASPAARASERGHRPPVADSSHSVLLPAFEPCPRPRAIARKLDVPGEHTRRPTTSSAVARSSSPLNCLLSSGRYSKYSAGSICGCSLQ